MMHDVCYDGGRDGFCDGRGSSCRPQQQQRSSSQQPPAASHTSHRIRAATLIYVDTGLVGLSPYPNNPTLTQYTKLDRPVWPRDMDPHGSGAFVISWQQARQQQPAKEALARL
jgi:hypothetical protein